MSEWVKKVQKFFDDMLKNLLSKSLHGAHLEETNLYQKRQKPERKLEQQPSETDYSRGYSPEENAQIKRANELTRQQGEKLEQRGKVQKQDAIIEQIPVKREQSLLTQEERDRQFAAMYEQATKRFRDRQKTEEEKPAPLVPIRERERDESRPNTQEQWDKDAENLYKPRKQPEKVKIPPLGPARRALKEQLLQRGLIVGEPNTRPINPKLLAQAAQNSKERTATTKYEDRYTQVAEQQKGRKRDDHEHGRSR